MINKLIDNKAKEGELTPCEKVLGDISRVARVAEFWEVNADLIELISANELLEYAQTEVFDSKEFAAFSKGVGKMGFFMAECAKELRLLSASKGGRQ